MDIFLKIIISLLAGLGAGLGTGFAGMSAAAVITPMLVTFLNIDPYTAVGIALASDVLASGISTITYAKNKNLDIKNGLVMMITILLFTLLGSYISKLVPSKTMGIFSVVMTLLLGIKFIIKPVNNPRERNDEMSKKKKIILSIIFGALIGFICGFVGAGGGMMMLLVLTSILHYDLKRAVGTSLFIMTFTALTGSISHFAMAKDQIDILVLILCIIFTLIFAQLAALIANKAQPKTLSRLTGVVLVVLGVVILTFNLITKFAGNNMTTDQLESIINMIKNKAILFKIRSR